ncbi:hypothetical protein [Methylocystis rosea]|uniref:Uncharacterized protein n=1 Tax=Methylocystis rosea TaxID=173366 RepID=A0A3G8M7Z6_9HYPH|nr:hypothetical protein [Methylocystis rosea]AZG77887.1 hypothetical protein EHO51_14735 [Methylocystis rosea]
MMKFFLRIGFLLWAFGGVFAARATPIDAPPTLTVGQMHGSCQKTCWTVREGAKGSESLRNSLTLTCLNACFKCFLQLRSCSQSSADSAPSECAAAFLQCYKQSFAERLKSKPLVSFDGGDGHSREMAVKIVGAANSLEGVPAEDFWIQLKHPGWRKKERRFVKEGGIYDVIVYDTPNGPQTVWFDVKDFYVKNGEEDLRLLAPK